MIPKRALISVAKKDGIKKFSKVLHDAGVEMYSTGGTRNVLQGVGIPVKNISEITDFTELMGGRVKTLHTNIYGGILARRDKDTDEMKKRDIKLLDMVICNFYDLAAVAKHKMENLDGVDIGGPSMVRAAAKNWKDVVIITDPCQYDKIAEKIQTGNIDGDTRKKLAIQAFAYTAWYDAMISYYIRDDLFPLNLSLPFHKMDSLRYGENPHQKAAAYRDCINDRHTDSVLTAEQLQGKKLSYNNILDADMAVHTINEFCDPTAVIIKHATPSGIASGQSVVEAWKDAFATDTYSPFGGITVVNRELTEELAHEMKHVFWEVILAPSYSKEALKIFSQKKNLRLLQMSALKTPKRKDGLIMRSIGGGLLLQERDIKPIQSTGWTVVTENAPNDDDLKSMVFAVRCVKHVKSNALVFVKDTRTVAIGGGQTSRVDASWIAVHKGQSNIKGSIMASDAFFPFRDAVDIAAKAGVKAIVQPGGSIRDEEVITAANEHNIAMVFSGQRCFTH